jgi:hypothetical protein
MFGSSMVLFEIDPHCASGAPFESDGPRAVDVDRVASGSTAQRVEVKARLMKRLEGRGRVDRRQTDQDPAVQIRSHSRTSAGLKQFSQSAMPKAFDHPDGM